MTQFSLLSPWGVARCLGLAVLAIWLANAVHSRVQLEHGGLAPDSNATSSDDPGVRVLLRNRHRDDDLHGQITVFVAQDALLYNAADPHQQWLAVSAGRTLHILPNVDQGFLITSRGFPEDLSWQGGPVRMVPDDHSTLDLLRRGNGAEDEQVDVFELLQRHSIEARNQRAVFSIGGRRYRGSLDVAWVNARHLAAINSLPVESYLEGVLQSELSATWPLETLKAQAVASRTYAVAKMLGGGSSIGNSTFHVRDSVADQDYQGTGNGGSKIDWAISATRGQVLSVNERVFTPFFHASSGGQLASVQDVFPDAAASAHSQAVAQVMRAQEDPFCRQGVEALGRMDSHWRRELRLSSGELRNMLRQRDEQAGWPMRITVNRSSSGHIRTITLGWAGGEASMSGAAFRTMVGANRLRSTLWSSDSPDRDREYFIFTSYGWGHGVGMSQMSAYAMAHFHGYRYREILNFFYSDSVIQQAWR